MKKLLAMVLALVMTLSLAVSANAAFKDADKVSADYSEAVAVLNGMGVFKGYEDGSFQPQGNITRAEVAAIVYRVYTADVKDAKASMYATYNKFSDMAGAGWAQGYIGYCANAALVKGYPNGTFQPSGKVTGYEVLAMILRAIGYDQNNEFTGADWALHVAQTAQQAGVLKNVKGVDLNAPASRELVAELLFRAIADAPMVTYTAAFGYQTVSFNGKKDSNKTFSENDTLGYKSFKLKSAKEADEFGRPTIKWTYDVGDKSTTVEVEALATYTEAAKNCDIYADSGLKKSTKLDVYTNSKTSDGTYTVADNKDDSKQADQGRLTLVYEDRLVNIDTYLAEVTKFVAEKTDSKGHTTSAYAIVDKNVHGYEGKLDTKFETKDEFKADDMVLVTIANGEIQSMVKAESKNAVLTDVSGNSKNISDIQKVKGLDKADATVNCTAKFAPATMTLGKTYNFYFDTYGNVIGADELASNYAVLDTLYMEHSKGVDTAYGDLYFFDADSKTDATINKVEGDDVADFEVSASKNKDYYYTVYAYSIDKDGAYTLDDSEFSDAYFASYNSGDKYLTVNATSSSANTRLQLSKDTKILLQTKESPKGTFTAYTGYEKLPSFKGYDVQYTTVNGYVDMIYVYAYEVTTRTVFIYDTTDYTSHWNDGKPYATFKAYELVDGKLTDTTIDLYYAEGQGTASHGVDEIGLYEVTMDSDYVWTAIAKYHAYTIDQLTTDGKRVKVNNTWFDLDDALVAKYEGTITKGKIDEDWTAKELAEKSLVFVQYDDSKVGDTHDALVVYDLLIKALVNDEELDEYYGHQFATIKVDLKEYEEISAAAMEKYNNNGTVGSTDLMSGVKYFDKDGKEVTMDADKGTKVAYAKISYSGVVTGDIIYTIANQAAYADAKLVDKDSYLFTNQDQSAKVENNTSVTGIAGTITVDLKQATVSAGDLVTLLNKEAKANENQTIAGVYNTQDVESSKVAADANLAGDMLVKVVAWDNKTVAYYRIAVTNAPTV